MRKKKENKENKPISKNAKIIIVVLFLFLVIHRLFSLFIVKESLNNTSASPVTTESEFIIISQCFSKYADAINSKNPDNVLPIYENDYKKENNITTENVLGINDLSDIAFFRIEKLYSNSTNYYAWVTFYSESDEANAEKNTYEFTIQFYRNNTFTLTPQIPENIV